VDRLYLYQPKRSQREDRAGHACQKIYERVGRVVVCLGDAGDAALVVDALKELSLMKEHLASQRKIYEKHILENKSQRWNAMTELFRNPWFKRVWVIQEVAVSPRILVRYGGISIHWSTLYISF
jgi:hypothetical protein